MGVSFYGNVKQNGQSTFIFDAIYSNRKEMEDKCQSDKVFVNRYVLVDYHYGGKDNNGKVISYDRYESINANTVEVLPTDLTEIKVGSIYRLIGENNYIYYQLIENENGQKEFILYYPTGDNLNLQETNGYHNNKMTDVNTYGCTYDGTVWMKIYHNATESYLLIGKFSDYSSPIFNFIELAPSDQLGMDIDYFHSSDLNYQVLYSKPWDIQLDVNSIDSVGVINNTTMSGNDGITKSFPISLNNQNNISLKPTNSKEESLMPTYQKITLTEDSYEKGKYYIITNGGYSKATGDFSIDTQYYIKIKTEYPVPIYQEITLTKDSYEKNKYYIKSNVGTISNPIYQYSKAIEDFDNTNQYYTKTISNETEEKLNTKLLSLNLPALGNGAIYLYDGLFGRPDGEIGDEGKKRPYSINDLKSLLDSTIGINSPTALCLTSALELLKSAVNRWDNNTPQVNWIANYYRKITENENSKIPQYEHRYKLEENGEYVEYTGSDYDFNNTYIIDKSFIQNRPKVIGEDAATILCQKIKLASTNFFYSTEES